MIRQFTVATESEQKFRMTSNNNSVDFQFLNGSRKGEIVGVEKYKSFTYTNGIKKYGNSNNILLYVKHLRDYIFWPQELRQKEILRNMPDKSIEQQKYKVVFASDVSGLSDSIDQYLLFFNPVSHRIDYIQFTMRRLMKSYTGVLRYEYGPRYLKTVYIQSKLEDDEFVHKIIIDNTHQK